MNGMQEIYVNTKDCSWVIISGDSPDLDNMIVENDDKAKSLYMYNPDKWKLSWYKLHFSYDKNTEPYAFQLQRTKRTLCTSVSKIINSAGINITWMLSMAQTWTSTHCFQLWALWKMISHCSKHSPKWRVRTIRVCALSTDLFMGLNSNQRGGKRSVKKPFKL